MKNFMNALEDQFNQDYNVSVTENGAVGYKTTRHALLDMNFKVASYRTKSEKEIIADFIEAYKEDKLHAIKWIFYVRDIRGGLGERRLFRVLFNYIAEVDPEIAVKLIKLVAEYGRYDDLFTLIGTKVDYAVFELVKSQLADDEANMMAGKSISLIAKWMPSVSTSSRKTVALANTFCKILELSPKQYRKKLSALRAYIDVVERKMSARKWGEIDYEAVPSKANLNYNNAFLTHDTERRRAYLYALSKGETKINASVLYPHEIVHEYCEKANFKFYAYLHGSSMPVPVDNTLEALWKAQKDIGVNDTLVVCDGSGSMDCRIGGTSATALEVANALAIYTAERCHGEFKNKFITFSSRPELVTIGAKTLRDNLITAFSHSDCSNTNIEATFDLILKTARNAHMKQEEMPKNVLIISDMEFDFATSRLCNANLFKIIAAKFEEAGYKLPRLIFWNVNSRTNTIPIRENDFGVALVSGFSVNILKMVMSEELDPYKLLINMLDTERYAKIEEALK